jgi:chemotaxis protein CheY-P-specific phosphatase CheC
MKNKKTIVILASVLAVCLLGVVLSQLIDWPVDTTKSSGNIAKTTRFSRKTAEDGASNMQELLLNDEDYKNGILATYVIMKARADQFSSLVNLSSEVAGDIKEFQPVLQDMKKALPTVNNVCSSLQTACEDLNSVFGGETPRSLEQNANNAALAYSTLQKLNNLADSFIATTDNYLKNSKGNDPLKLIRDQWVSYQQVTAVLSDDAQLAQDLEERGFLLNAEQTRSALNEFDNSSLRELSNTISGAAIAKLTEQLDNKLCDIFIDDLVKNSGSMDDLVKNSGSMDDLVKNSGSMDDLVKNSGSMDDLVKNSGFGDAGKLISNTFNDLANLKSSFDFEKIAQSATDFEKVSNNFQDVVKAFGEGDVLKNSWDFQK